MRMKTETYVGNPLEATQQILGPVMLPSEWTGIWRTTQLTGTPVFYKDSPGGANQIITIASTLRDYLETIFESGQRLRVTWSTQSYFNIDGKETITPGDRRIVRIGRASEWKFSHDRMDDIAWSISFEWISKGSSSQKAISIKDEDELAQARNYFMNLSNANTQLITNKLVVSNTDLAGVQTATSLTLGDIESLANGPIEVWNSFLSAGTNALNAIGRIIQVAQDIGNLPDILKNQTHTSAKNMVTICKDCEQKLSQIPYENYTNSNNFNVNKATQAKRAFDLYFENVKDVLDAGLDLVKITASKKSAQVDGSNTRSDSLSQTDIIGVWVARKGDTYASISNKFYGTPDYSYALAKVNANALPSVLGQGGAYPVRGRAYAISPPIGATLVIPNITVIKTANDI